jgi:hypothetical protein
MTQTNLAQRLGYRSDDRLLIVNCDDLGSSHSANVATFRAMVYGVATSATLMVPCPWARKAARMFEGLAIGVHLTLTSEHRGYRWRGLTNGASLHDDEVSFRPRPRSPSSGSTRRTRAPNAGPSSRRRSPGAST